MWNTSNTAVELGPRPRLLAPREVARALLDLRIRLGVALLEREITSVGELELLEQDSAEWHHENREVLGQLFDSDQPRDEYRAAWSSVTLAIDPTPEQELRLEHKDLRERCDRLRTLWARLEDFEEA
jgi:hypothetical protein